MFFLIILLRFKGVFCGEVDFGWIGCCCCGGVDVFYCLCCGYLVV